MYILEKEDARKQKLSKVEEKLSGKTMAQAEGEAYIAETDKVDGKRQFMKRWKR